MLAKSSPQTPLCAAGGVALGADGVLVGSRLWATSEASVSRAMHRAALRAGGVDTVRSQVMDNRPGARLAPQVQRKGALERFVARWHGSELELRLAGAEVGRAWADGWAEGDPDRSTTFVGEGVGLIGAVSPAQVVLEQMAGDAAQLLGRSRSASG